MLYLRRLLPIPERGTEWQIWQVASRANPEAETVVGQMIKWINKVRAKREELGLDLMDEVIHGMTEPDRSARSTIHAAVEALGAAR